MTRLSDEARAELERLSREEPERQIIFCTGCGHVHTGGKSGRRINFGGDYCERTIQTGTPVECLAAFEGDEADSGAESEPERASQEPHTKG